MGQHAQGSRCLGHLGCWGRPRSEFRPDAGSAIYAGEWVRPFRGPLVFPPAASTPNFHDVEQVCGRPGEPERRWIPREAVLSASALLWGWPRGNTHAWLKEAQYKAEWMLEELEGALRWHVFCCEPIDDAQAARDILVCFQNA